MRSSNSVEVLTWTTIRQDTLASINASHMHCFRTLTRADSTAFTWTSSTPSLEYFCMTDVLKRTRSGGCAENVKYMHFIVAISILAPLRRLSSRSKSTRTHSRLPICRCEDESKLSSKTPWTALWWNVFIVSLSAHATGFSCMWLTTFSLNTLKTSCCNMHTATY